MTEPLTELLACPQCGASNIQAQFPVWLDLNHIEATPDWTERIDHEARPETDSARCICGTCHENIIPVKMSQARTEIMEKAGRLLTQLHVGTLNNINETDRTKRVLALASANEARKEIIAMLMIATAHLQHEPLLCPVCKEPIEHEEGNVYAECSNGHKSCSAEHF